MVKYIYYFNQESWSEWINTGRPSEKSYNSLKELTENHPQWRKTNGRYIREEKKSGKIWKWFKNDPQTGEPNIFEWIGEDE